jgi:hypothetical protein
MFTGQEEESHSSREQQVSSEQQSSNNPPIIAKSIPGSWRSHQKDLKTFSRCVKHTKTKPSLSSLLKALNLIGFLTSNLQS